MVKVNGYADVMQYIYIILTSIKNKIKLGYQ